MVDAAKVANGMSWSQQLMLRDAVEGRRGAPSGNKARAAYGMARRRIPLVLMTRHGYRATPLGDEVYDVLRKRRPDLFKARMSDDARALNAAWVRGK